MALRIEDYALIGDTQTAALVGRDGSIDWLCVPRFDSAACFAALLGEPGNGRWLLAPRSGAKDVRRRYLPETLVLETEMDCAEGTIRIYDFMPPRDQASDVMRIVEGVRGRVPVTMELVIRFDYGSVVPWVRRADDTLRAVAGPDALELRTPTTTRGVDFTTIANFEVGPGQRAPFVLTWYPSHLPPPRVLDPEAELEATLTFWRDWTSKCTYRGPYREDVVASLRILKALTYEPTGAIVAAPTTSLPEKLGGPRNWDYRFSWLRDSTMTLYALLLSGYHDEATAWREWLLRAVAGDPAKLQIMYGLAGERRLTEWTIDWLPGYQGSRPVRVGNLAAEQFQLDVYGEVIDTLYQAARTGLAANEWSWQLQQNVLKFLETAWQQPDEGLWEVRGPRRHFTHSKIMAWVAFDRAVKSVESFGWPGPVDRWRAQRDAIHEEVCRRGYDAAANTFVQSYDARDLDASLLMIPLVGFLPPADPRVVGTVAAIERGLMVEGFVRRYHTREEIDGLPPGEGLFLACTFWLADNYASCGRRDEAAKLFERLLALRNDVGLLAEQYDPRGRRLLGNFPQALSHLALVNTAYNLGHEVAPAEHRPAKSGG
jgi:GH15 family glucan-1,4-alpha-glucosidase